MIEENVLDNKIINSKKLNKDILSSNVLHMGERRLWNAAILVALERGILLHTWEELFTLLTMNFWSHSLL